MQFFSSFRPKFIEHFVRNSLYYGINIARMFFFFIYYFVLRSYALACLTGRQFLYLGSSNSQMRDQGCYFLNADDNKLEKFRQSLGRFEGSIKSVPKVDARIRIFYFESCVFS